MKNTPTQTVSHTVQIKKIANSFNPFILSLLCLSFLGCSTELDPDVSAVNLQLSPRTIIVSEADTRQKDGVDENGNIIWKDLKGPWFQFRFRVINDSQKQLVITNMIVRASTFKNGQKTEGSLSIDATAIDESKIGFDYDGDGETAGDVLNFLFNLPRKDTKTFPLSFFFDSLPESDDLSYNLTITARGHFGTETSPEKAFRKEFLFSASSGL